MCENTYLMFPSLGRCADRGFRIKKTTPKYLDWIFPLESPFHTYLSSWPVNLPPCKVPPWEIKPIPYMGVGWLVMIFRHMTDLFCPKGSQGRKTSPRPPRRNDVRPWSLTAKWWPLKNDAWKMIHSFHFLGNGNFSRAKCSTSRTDVSSLFQLERWFGFHLLIPSSKFFFLYLFFFLKVGYWVAMGKKYRVSICFLILWMQKKHMSGCLELSRFQFANRQIRSCWAEPGKGFCGCRRQRPRGHGHIVEKSA